MRKRVQQSSPVKKKKLRVLTALASLALLLIALSIGMFSLAPARANTTIALDTFNRTVTNGWGTADLGGSWTVLDTSANWSVAPGVGKIIVHPAAEERGILGNVAVQDVDILAKIVLPRCTNSGTNCDAYVIGRYTGGSTPNYYRIGAIQGAGQSTIYLRAQRSDGSNLSNDLNTGITAASGVTVWAHVQFQGVNPTAIRARIWKNNTPEPSTWLLNTTDNTSAEQVAGAVGVRARNEDTNTSRTFKYEKFQVTDLSSGGPTPTPTQTNTPNPTNTPSPTMTPSPSITPSPTNTPVSGSAASDSFQRTTPSGWGFADSGGWWTVVGSPWNWSVSPGAGKVIVGANSEERAYLSSFNIQNVDIVEKVVLPRCSGSTNCDAYVIGRYAPAYTPTYYRVGVVQGAGRADIYIRAQRSDGTNIGSDVDTGLPASAGVVVWLHVQFQGTNPTAIRARAWLDGTGEPGTWTLNATDSNSAEQQAGMVGVRMRNEDTSNTQTFQVESYTITGTAVPVTVQPNPTGSTTAHWLYVVDDGMVYAYDIDHNHALVKQFPIPEAGKRGVAVSPNRGLLYVTECGTGNCSGQNGSLLAYDLVHDVVAWIANYSFGVDQLAITPDGSTIYMPHGADASDGTHSILDASNGKPLGSIQTGTNGHNTIVSLDGTQVYLNGYTGSNYNYAHVYNTANNQSILNAGPTVNGVRPFTINGKHTLMFTTSTNTCGFQVLSLTTGSVIYTVTFSGSCNWTVSNAPSHGISLSPDEKRVYVMDAPLDQLEVYDVSGLPSSAPKFVASVQLSSLSGTETPCQTYCEKEGWVLNDLSGRYVYVGDTGDVIDTSTLKSIMVLPALQNTRQLVEIDWTNGTPSATSTRFGIGRVTG
jgi:6-phosphogluconolactonase (cycloisomerase 2 family)